MMTDAEVDIYVGKVLRKCLPLLLIAIVAPIGSLLIDTVSNCSEPKFWFQRSGAISVIIWVWIQSMLVKIDIAINPSPANYLSNYAWREKYQNNYEWISKLTIAILIISTFIWGYGDLPFK